LEFDADKREIEIGFTFLARSHWGGKYNGEMKRLMLDHAFQFVDSVLLLVGLKNIRSQKAVEKIGGVVTGRRESFLRGKLVEHIVYAVHRHRHAIAERAIDLLPGEGRARFWPPPVRLRSTL
jgi:RimJ/RimL family protein N-acetyltransferase